MALKSPFGAKEIETAQKMVDPEVAEMQWNEKEKVTSRMSHEDLGKCPICKKTLTTARANGHAVVVCLDHRVALPSSDQ